MVQWVSLWGLTWSGPICFILYSQFCCGAGNVQGSNPRLCRGRQWLFLPIHFHYRVIWDSGIPVPHLGRVLVCSFISRLSNNYYQCQSPHLFFDSKPWSFYFFFGFWIVGQPLLKIDISKFLLCINIYWRFRTWIFWNVSSFNNIYGMFNLGAFQVLF